MPTYEYKCKQCKYIFEELQPISAPALTTCPSCRRETLKRMIGAGGGLIFKGSGFYVTDYKRKSKGDRKGKDKEKGKDVKETKSDARASDSATSNPDNSPTPKGRGDPGD